MDSHFSHALSLDGETHFLLMKICIFVKTRVTTFLFFVFNFFLRENKIRNQNPKENDSLSFGKTRL